MHVPRLTADEGFIYFDFAASRAELASKEIIPQSQPEPLNHKPCRLLGDAQSAVNFHAADAVLAIDQHPESRHPLIESERRIFKDRSQLERELLLAGVAKPDAPRLNERVFLGAATWTGHLAVRPAKLFGVLESAVSVREVDDCLLECFRSVHV